ncbi:MAG: HaeII family restriction endonuclease, partial [Fimbriimonadales bacterium]
MPRKRSSDTSTTDEQADVAESTTAEEIVIVCRDGEADILQSVASQLGRRIRGII